MIYLAYSLTNRSFVAKFENSDCNQEKIAAVNQHAQKTIIVCLK